MSVLDFVDRYSFKQILSIAILLAVLFALPTTVWLVSQQTRLYSSAHKENLPANNYTQEAYGQPSAFPPKITRVRPFLGKVDDVVIIEGENFGQNPQNRAIYFGSVRADERDILMWHDNRIDVMVPNGAPSGMIKVVEIDKETTAPYPITIYDKQTPVRVYWDNQSLVADNAFNVSRVLAITGNGQQFQANISGAGKTVLLSNLPTKDLMQITLYDRAGNQVSFWVNPIDFRF